MLNYFHYILIAVLAICSGISSDGSAAQSVTPPAPFPGESYLIGYTPIQNDETREAKDKKQEEKSEEDDLDFLEKDMRELSQTRVNAPMMDTEVTSVMRTPTTIGRTPAAIFVITQEMIRRSGATDIPELLRMVPGIEVARINASQWSVTCRGFSGVFANKLLVQIDGRSIYNMVFSGVFWESNLVMLQDIDRIEVIRGPGASVWGSNAVNGVINIITKSSKDTQGMMFWGAAGNEVRGITNIRYGGKVSDNLTWRLYGMFQDQDEGYLPGTQTYDDWRSAQCGFRMDWEPNRIDKFTVQGDIYNGYSGGEFCEYLPTFPYKQNIIGDTHMSGGNVIGRWTRDFDDDNGWALQFYYDRMKRTWPLSAGAIDVIDVDFQRQVPLGDRHQIVWGAEYRHHKDICEDTYTVSLLPPGKELNIYSYFIQDQVTLVEDTLFLTVGSKFEHNDYTGFEYQPTIRALWSIDERRAVWGAVSRAVRIPNRVNRSTYNHTGVVHLGPSTVSEMVALGSDNVISEDLLAWELGYRAQPTDQFSWDLALFFNQYNNLVSVQPTTPWPTVPTWYWVFANCMDGETYGFELTADYQVNPQWKLRLAYSYLQMYLHMEDGYTYPVDSQDKWSPNNQVYFQSSWDWGRSIHFDMMLRYVDALTALNVPSYVTMDFRLAWQPNKQLEVAVVGRNLLQPQHLEYTQSQGPYAMATEIERGFYGSVSWRY